MSDLTSLQSEISSLDSHWYKLLFYVGKGEGKNENLAEKLGIPYVNVNLVLSEKLKDLPRSKYTMYVDDILSDYFQKFNCELLWLGDIEILFDKQLHINPIRLLENMSKRYKIIVSWAGNAADNKLIYAEPGHPEYYICNDFEGKVVTN